MTRTLTIAALLISTAAQAEPVITMLKVRPAASMSSSSTATIEKAVPGAGDLQRLYFPPTRVLWPLPRPRPSTLQERYGLPRAWKAN